MSLSQRLVVAFFRGLTSLICRIDDAELARVPRQGPLILYTNHVNILEIPIIYTRLQPRRQHGMALAERWENPVLGWLLNVAQSIPVHRGQADISAIRKGLEILKQGEILMIAPEGTRSHDGRLGAARPGVVVLALHSRAQLMPVAFYGAVRWMENLRGLKRTDFHMRVGRPFHLDERGEKVTGAVRRKMLDEMMYQLSAVLPEEYRGVYADQENASTKYIVFEGGSYR